MIYPPESTAKKVALITGSATGLGAVIANKLGLSGYSVIINYKNSYKEAQEAVTHLTSRGVSAIAIQADVADPLQVEELVHQSLSVYGHIDVLIHGAGPFLRDRKPLIENSNEDWFSMIHGNLSSAFFLCKNIIPSMRRQGFGRIITFGYDRAETAPDQFYRGPYASAKTGLVTLTKTLAIEERPHGITVNMVCPGDIRRKEKEAALQQLLQEGHIHPQNPCLSMVNTIEYLLSPGSKEINGSVLTLNGGKNIFHEIDLPNFSPESPIQEGTWVKVFPWDGARGKVVQVSIDYYHRCLYSIEGVNKNIQGTFTQYQIEVEKNLL